MSRPLLAPSSHVRDQPANSGNEASCRTSVTAPFRLPVSPAAPHLAREFVRDSACPRHLADPEEALLLVSELVTNALVHGKGPMDLTLRCEGARTIIGVSDGGAGLPVFPATAPAVDATAGRGLWMLVVLADDWGVRSDTHAKTIWFALADRAADLTL
jgi:hypothetical protein